MGLKLALVLMSPSPVMPIFLFLHNFIPHFLNLLLNAQPSFPFANTQWSFLLKKFFFLLANILPSFEQIIFFVFTIEDIGL